MINVFLGTLGGYAFARLRFPLREVLFLVVLGTLMIPDQLRLVPVYLMMVDFPVTGWNLTQTLHGYVFFGTSIALATNLFLMRQYFLTIPKDYEEAAKLDGAGYFKTYWRVMLPARGAGRRGRRDPDLPGHLERVLLGEPAPRPGELVGVDGPDRRGPVPLPVPDALAAAHGGGDDRDRPRPASSTSSSSATSSRASRRRE